MKPLTATLRLQFHKGFTLDDAVPLVDYFAALGVSHLYASPLLTARPGSMHGYDVVDPTRVNPELGGEPALLRLVGKLREHGMGLILDIVSNHMAVGGSANPWWLDVLEWGPSSAHAKFFDIQWASTDPLLHGQLLVPFLRTDYGEVLKAGEITLHFDADNGTLYAQHYEHRFPLTPPSYAEILQASDDLTLTNLAERFGLLRPSRSAHAQAKALSAELLELVADNAVSQALEAALERYRVSDAESMQRLHRLLERQHYRLASWRTAADDINWRRFFDVNELGGLRVERPEVFEATHAKVFELIERGLIDGLRIDHVDGLANPRGYCRKLRRRVERLLENRPQEARVGHFPIYVEKILGHGEQLPADWDTDGTTGYEFMDQVSLLQHESHGQPYLAALWNNLTGRPADFIEEVLEARQLVLAGSLAGDVETVAQALLLVARDDLMTRDLTLGAIRRALLELIRHFPVYRTYATVLGRSPEDQQVFQQALDGARTTLPEADWPLLDYLDRWLGGEPQRRLPPSRSRKLRRLALTRFQQLTSPAAAKAVEDTAFYRSAVLLSRNDVGFDPATFSASVAQFHQRNMTRAQHFPRNLLTTATHDHKRGEDVRARLATLSERAVWFSERVHEWRSLSEPLRAKLADGEAPCAADELMLYQTLLGSWPLDLDTNDAERLRAYTERLHGWQEKALREAKLRSSWSAPNQTYETACREFLDKLLNDPAQHTLLEQIAQAAESLAPAGALNSLGQCLLRMTSPGLPDLYQGDEFWDFSLVDPDNRRPVDYPARQAALAQPAALAELLPHWRDGRVKQGLIAAVLQLRAQQAELFAVGDYLPLEVGGEQAHRVLAFARVNNDKTAIVVVPRLSVPLLEGESLPLIPAERWGDTYVDLPQALQNVELRSLCLPFIQPEPGRERLALSEILTGFPVAVLLSTFD
jgi:(1->4)-alpha-D-glucan 1-alpha-D-glucosylmutase